MIAEVRLNTSKCEVHLGQLPGRVSELLAIDRDVSSLAAVSFHKLG